VVGFGKVAITVGQLAKRQAVTNAENTVYSIKRFIGRRWNDTEAERHQVPYYCVRGQSDTVDVQIRGRTYTPRNLHAPAKLKQDAESFFGETVNQACAQPTSRMRNGRQLKMLVRLPD